LSESGNRFNLATQRLPGKHGDPEAIETALRGMVERAEGVGIATIEMPRIGAGIGGLDWSVVSGIIQRVAASTPVELVVFEKGRPVEGDAACPGEPDKEAIVAAD
jgi:O-acetyl-ADP-ribose deacetylase (regulator of RNase III)